MIDFNTFRDFAARTPKADDSFVVETKNNIINLKRAEAGTNDATKNIEVRKRFLASINARLNSSPESDAFMTELTASVLGTEKDNFKFQSKPLSAREIKKVTDQAELHIINQQKDKESLSIAEYQREVEDIVTRNVNSVKNSARRYGGTLFEPGIVANGYRLALENAARYVCSLPPNKKVLEAFRNYGKQLALTCDARIIDYIAQIENLKRALLHDHAISGRDFHLVVSETAKALSEAEVFALSPELEAEVNAQIKANEKHANFVALKKDLLVGTLPRDARAPAEAPELGENMTFDEKFAHGINTLEKEIEAKKEAEFQAKLAQAQAERETLKSIADYFKEEIEISPRIKDDFEVESGKPRLHIGHEQAAEYRASLEENFAPEMENLLKNLASQKEILKTIKEWPGRTGTGIKLANEVGRLINTMSILISDTQRGAMQMADLKTFMESVDMMMQDLSLKIANAYLKQAISQDDKDDFMYIAMSLNALAKSAIDTITELDYATQMEVLMRDEPPKSSKSFEDTDITMRGSKEKYSAAEYSLEMKRLDTAEISPADRDNLRAMFVKSGDTPDYRQALADAERTFRGAKIKEIIAKKTNDFEHDVAVELGDRIRAAARELADGLNKLQEDFPKLKEFGKYMKRDHAKESLPLLDLTSTELLEKLLKGKLEGVKKEVFAQEANLDHGLGEYRVALKTALEEATEKIFDRIHSVLTADLFEDDRTILTLLAFDTDKVADFEQALAEKQAYYEKNVIGRFAQSLAAAQGEVARFRERSAEWDAGTVSKRKRNLLMGAHDEHRHLSKKFIDVNRNEVRYEGPMGRSADAESLNANRQLASGAKTVNELVRGLYADIFAAGMPVGAKLREILLRHADEIQLMILDSKFIDVVRIPGEDKNAAAVREVIRAFIKDIAPITNMGALTKADFAVALKAALDGQGIKDTRVNELAIKIAAAGEEVLASMQAKLSHELTDVLKKLTAVDAKLKVDEKTLAELGGTGLGSMENGYGKFLANVLDNYFTSPALKGEHAKFLESFYRNGVTHGTVGDALSALIKGAGPIFQKVLQSIPTDGLPKEITKALRDVKSGLAPIPDEYIEKRLMDYVKVANQRTTNSQITYQQTLDATLRLNTFEDLKNPLIQKLIPLIAADEVYNPAARQLITKLVNGTLKKEDLGKDQKKIRLIADELPAFCTKLNNSYRITAVDVMDNFGAASVGQALKCLFHTQGHNVEAVIKILRPGVEERAKNERPFFDEMAKLVGPSMQATFAARMDGIMKEFDFSNEAGAIDQGEVYGQSGNYKFHEVTEEQDALFVKSVKVENRLPRQKDVLALEVAAGQPFDRELRDNRRRLSQILKLSGNKLHNSFEYIVQHGELVDLYNTTKKHHKMLLELVNRFSEELISRNYGVKDGQGGFMHGDLHGGNIMVARNSLTVIDYGNAQRLNKAERETLVRFIAGCGFAKGETVLQSVLEGSGKKPKDIPNYDQILKDVQAIVSKGTANDAAPRGMAVVKYLNEHGVTVPGPIFNFTETVMRLNAVVKESEAVIAEVERALKDITPPDNSNLKDDPYLAAGKDLFMPFNRAYFEDNTAESLTADKALYSLAKIPNLFLREKNPIPYNKENYQKYLRPIIRIFSRMQLGSEVMRANSFLLTDLKRDLKNPNTLKRALGNVSDFQKIVKQTLKHIRDYAKSQNQLKFEVLSEFNECLVSGIAALGEKTAFDILGTKASISYGVAKSGVKAITRQAFIRDYSAKVLQNDYAKNTGFVREADRRLADAFIRDHLAWSGKDLIEELKSALVKVKQGLTIGGISPKKELVRYAMLGFLVRSGYLEIRGTAELKTDDKEVQELIDFIDNDPACKLELEMITLRQKNRKTFQNEQALACEKLTAEYFRPVDFLTKLSPNWQKDDNSVALVKAYLKEMSTNEAESKLIPTDDASLAKAMRKYAYLRAFYRDGILDKLRALSTSERKSLSPILNEIL